MTKPRELSLSRVLERFPALRQIGVLLEERRRIPVILQMTMLDCGASCLAMVLAYNGKRVVFEQIREQVGVSRDGASAKAIVQAARRFGLRARGIQIELQDLPDLPKGSILHWEFNHFVVFEAFDGRALDIVDPALGRRRIDLDQARTALTGVALLLDPTDEFEPGDSRGASVWRALAASLRQDRRWLRIVVVATLMQLFALSMPIAMGAVADQVVPRNDGHLLLVMMVGLGGVVAFNALAALIRAHLLLEFRTTLDVRMSVTLVEHMASLPFSFFQKRPAGDLMMRLNGNAAVRDILSASTLSALVDGTMVVSYLLVLLFVAPGFGALALGLGTLQVLTFVLARSNLQRLSAEHLNTSTRTQSYQFEMIAGMETLKAMGVEDNAVERWVHHFVDASNVAIARGRLSAVVEAAQNSLRLAAPLVTLMTGTLLVLRHDVSLGAMLAMQALAIGFFTPITNLMSAGEQLLLLASYLERLDDVFATKAEQDPAQVLAPAQHLTGQVSVERVSFRYGEHAPWVVRDVSIDIAPGQFVAIVGKSGSGKSTLASLLLALHRPTAGRVLFDGIDLACLDVRGLRRQLGVVLQKPYVFGDSIRNNIAIASSNIALEQVIEAARGAQIHEDIQAMGMGYETLVSDGGSSLSGGQRQRVALARALVNRPCILLLDEATSALDSETESRVQATIDALGCTRIVIAHRLSTVVDAGLILVMKDGQIVERGNHETLLALRGEYHSLVTAQLSEARAARQIEEQLSQLMKAETRDE